MGDVSEVERQAALDHLRQSVASRGLELEVFSDAASAVLSARTSDELAVVLARTAPVVRMTSPERVLHEPLNLNARSSTLQLTSSWQIARQTKVTCGSGRVVLDLTAAEFDALVVDLDLTCTSGTIDVIVPFAIGVQFVEMSGTSGRIDNRISDNVALPGMPCVRVRARTTSGRITVRRPEPPREKRRWFRRRKTVL
jgi:hypothetical protein